MGDIGLTNTESRQWECVINQWFRLRSMDENRLNNKVFKWAYSQGSNRYKNWCKRVKQQIRKCDLENFFGMLIYPTTRKAFIKQNVKDSRFDVFKVKWRQNLSRGNALGGAGKTKLRTAGYLNMSMRQSLTSHVYALSYNEVLTRN